MVYENGMIWATCPDCSWRAEADDPWDAKHASMNHWADTHDNRPDCGPPSHLHRSGTGCPKRTR